MIFYQSTNLTRKVLASLRNKPTQTQGFSYVQLMISVSIIVMITALMLANYRPIEQRSRVIWPNYQLANDVRLAQNYSLGSKLYNGVVPTGGWGIYFDSRTSGDRNKKYIFFADVNGDRDYDSSGAGEANPNYGGKTVNFPAGIWISNIRVVNFSGATANPNRVYITYIPPDPQILICAPDSSSCNRKSATIYLTDGSRTASTTINVYGLIDANN